MSFRYIATIPMVTIDYRSRPMFRTVGDAVHAMRAWHRRGETRVALSEEIDPDAHTVTTMGDPCWMSNPYVLDPLEDRALDLWPLMVARVGWRVAAEPCIRLSYGPRGGVIVQRY